VALLPDSCQNGTVDARNHLGLHPASDQKQENPNQQDLELDFVDCLAEHASDCHADDLSSLETEQQRDFTGIKRDICRISSVCVGDFSQLDHLRLSCAENRWNHQVVPGTASVPTNLPDGLELVSCPLHLSDDIVIAAATSDVL
jgi:hypothetical protein